MNDDAFWLEDAQRTRLLLIGILLAACRDMADCQVIGHKVPLQNDQIELLWQRLIDCVERLEYVDDAFDGPLMDFLRSETERLLGEFQRHFGAGLYCSPEILVGRETCNICRRDYRACDHRAGNIYGGKMCHRIAEDVELRASSIVHEPVDRRCRIWPWNYDSQRNQVSAAILTVFSLESLEDPGPPGNDTT